MPCTEVQYIKDWNAVYIDAVSNAYYIGGSTAVQVAVFGVEWCVAGA